jgi:hypothetical protein
MLSRQDFLGGGGGISSVPWWLGILCHVSLPDGILDAIAVEEILTDNYGSSVIPRSMREEKISSPRSLIH